MNKIYVSLIIVFLSLPAFGQYQNDASDIKAWLALIKELIFQPYPEEPGRDYDVYKLFGQAVDQLALGSKTKLNLSEMEATFIALARDKKKRPKLYKEIEEVYIKGVDSKESVFPSSPILRDEHCFEEYRLPWEYFLLMPPGPQMSPLYDHRVCEAIGIIGNEASLPILKWAFMATTNLHVHPEDVQDRQQAILSAINHFSSEPGLITLLDCLEMSRQQASVSGENGVYQAIEDHIFRLLTDQENYGNGDQWKSLIRKYSKEDLPPYQVALLNKVIRK